MCWLVGCIIQLCSTISILTKRNKADGSFCRYSLSCIKISKKLAALETLAFLSVSWLVLELLDGIYLIIVDLEGGVHPRPAEPHHVVLPVIHLAAGVSDHDVLLAEVVGDHHIATDLNIFIYNHKLLYFPPSSLLPLSLVCTDLARLYHNPSSLSPSVYQSCL